MAEKEYIERDKAIDACFDGWNNNAHDCAENIRSIPAADVESVRVAALETGAACVERGRRMITMTIDIASVFLGMILGCCLTLFVCWLGGMF